MCAAVGLAILVHGAVFLIGFDRFSDATLPPRIAQFVTVTMSYRQNPVKAKAAEKKEEAPSQEIPEPKKVEAPKPRQKPVLGKPSNLEEQESVSVVQQEELRAVGEEKVSDAARREEASPRDSAGATGQVREAVPLYKINPPPRYPRAAKRRGSQGTVVLSVFVDAQGHVANLWIFESSGYRVLDTAALEAVKKWSFEPGRKGSTKVAMWVNVPVRFELR